MAAATGSRMAAARTHSFLGKGQKKKKNIMAARRFSVTTPDRDSPCRRSFRALLNRHHPRRRRRRRRFVHAHTRSRTRINPSPRETSTMCINARSGHYGRTRTEIYIVHMCVWRRTRTHGPIASVGDWMVRGGGKLKQKHPAKFPENDKKQLFNNAQSCTTPKQRCDGMEIKSRNNSNGTLHCLHFANQFMRIVASRGWLYYLFINFFFPRTALYWCRNGMMTNEYRCALIKLKKN